jgi:hypothetical protein
MAAIASFWADSTTLAQLFAAVSADARRVVLDSRLGSGTLTVNVKDGTGTTKASGTLSGADFTVAVNCIDGISLAGESGVGGTPDSSWTIRIDNGAGAWIEFPQPAWSFIGDGGSGVIDTADNIVVDCSIGATGSYVPSTPPAAVETWIVQPGSFVSVPADFIGIHSDYLTGSAYVVNPGWMDKVGLVRTLDYDPNKGGAGQISWAAIEQSAGSYTWTKLDAWVTENTGKLLVYVLNQCPNFYAKYTTAYNLYPAYTNGSSPPSDWTKASNFLLAIKARYPDENWIFEIWNEPSLPWSTETGGTITVSNTYDTRRSDAWMAVQNITRGQFYIGTARDLMDGAKVLYQAGVRPLMGCAWEGDGSETNTVYSDVWRMMTCPTSGGGVGADWFDYLSWHHYTYSGDARTMLTEGLAYKARFATWGLSSKPWMISECGHETTLANTLGNEQHSTNVIRWGYIAAALGSTNLGLYQLDSDDAARTLKFYAVENTAAKIAANDALQSAIETVYTICGKTIGQAARLSDGSIWLEFTDNTTVRQ